MGNPNPLALRMDPLRSDDEARALFAGRARSIVDRHGQQNREAVTALRARYAKPLFGKVRVWQIIEWLGQCVDPTDQRLFGASQQVHILQVLEAMEADGVATPEMVLVALVHDLGKVLLLTDEDPANVVCMNSAIGDHPDGLGLDNCLIQWNHDEFAYQRLEGRIPDELAWLVRYHSLELSVATHLMDARDLELAERLLVPFAHYDHATKTPFNLPSGPISRYREVIEDTFPRRIPF